MANDVPQCRASIYVAGWLAGASQAGGRCPFEPMTFQASAWMTGFCRGRATRLAERFQAWRERPI